MSETVQLALIAGLPSFIAALVAAYVSVQNHRKIATVAVAVDGLLTAKLEAQEAKGAKAEQERAAAVATEAKLQEGRDTAQRAAGAKEAEDKAILVAAAKAREVKIEVQKQDLVVDPIVSVTVPHPVAPPVAPAPVGEEKPKK